jgi:hypothetical protein
MHSSRPYFVVTTLASDAVAARFAWIGHLEHAGHEIGDASRSTAAYRRAGRYSARR